jgi:hypothetical protein
LFTEFGYRSIQKCADEPWSYDRSKTDLQSQEAQARALKVLFETFWDEEYFAGGFLWKWYPKHAKAGGSRDTMFTVQNKKAEAVVRKAYFF